MARVQDRRAREGTHGDLLTLIHGQSHVQLGIDGFTDQNLCGIGLGDEAHQACGQGLKVSLLFLYTPELSATYAKSSMQS